VITWEVRGYMVVENLIWKNFKWNENEEFGKLNLAEESLAKNLLRKNEMKTALIMIILKQRSYMLRG
jgi:hypothetical protein